MSRNTIVINVDLRETRVALIEDGVIAELQIERATHRGSVGNIVLAKVTRVLPGMQAAFLDIGMERAAFLHVEDLIRPDDFETYMSGDARDEESSFRGEVGRGRSRVSTDEEDDENGDTEDDDDAEDDDESDLDESDGGGEDDSQDDDEDDDDAADDDDPAVSDDKDDEDDEDDDDAADDDDPAADAADDDDPEASDEDQDGAGEDTTEAPAAKSKRRPQAAAQGGSSGRASRSPGGAEDESGERQDATDARDDDPESVPTAESTDTAPRENRRRRGGRRRGRGNAGGSEAPDTAAQGEATEASSADSGAQPSERANRAGRGRGRRRRRRGEGSSADNPPRERGDGRRTPKQGKGKQRRKDTRVSRNVPITEVVKEGDEVVVQISKEPIGTKGARVTSHVSLPGRYVVYVPTVDHVGISKRIGNARERARLKKVIDTVKPPKGGLIVRTVAEGLTKKQLKADIGYLVKVWEEVGKRRDGQKAPTTLYTELDLVLKIARDMFTTEINKIIIDDREQFARLVRFIEMFMPERVNDIELYKGAEPIFDAYGIEDEIGRALSRKVPLPSGGYLIIDQAEALTAIDVNTGRFVGKGSKDLEETAFKTNLEAVDEIAYQLRFRNIGGLVILDLIDMDRGDHRDKVVRALEQKLAKDKAKTTLNRISELGLVEMTRKRTRESLGRMLHEPCFYCDGTGQIQSRATIAYEILRQIRRELRQLPGYSVLVNAHPAVVDYMQTEEKDALAEAARRFARRIELVSRSEYHIEQFDLHGK